jgi:hypothetical protein
MIHTIHTTTGKNIMMHSQFSLLGCDFIQYIEQRHQVLLVHKSLSTELCGFTFQKTAILSYHFENLKSHRRVHYKIYYSKSSINQFTC